MKKRWELYLAGMLFLAFSLGGCGEKVHSENAEKTFEKETAPMIVIDPGHGGEDPGKVASSGELEKDLNLQIAQKVKEKLEAQGYAIVMTREDDGKKNSKREDMQMRVDLINKKKPLLTVSIHQNSYPDSSVNGPQVFYYVDSEKGRELAQMIQSELWEVVQSQRRQIKGNNNYYMLLHTEVPTVIVECGFLSNWEETKKLTDDFYQDLLADAICKGIRKWLDK